MRVGLWRRLSAEGLMLLNRGVGEDSWESLGLQRDPTVHPKGNQSWIFIGKTDAEAETPILWHLMQRTDSFEKNLMLGKTEGGRKRGWQRMRWVGWHHWFNGHDFVWILGVGDRQGSLACFMRSMGSQRVGHDWATELNWTELITNSSPKPTTKLYQGGSFHRPFWNMSLYIKSQFSNQTCASSESFLQFLISPPKTDSLD